MMTNSAIGVVSNSIKCPLRDCQTDISVIDKDGKKKKPVLRCLYVNILHQHTVISKNLFTLPLTSESEAMCVHTVDIYK